MAIKIQYTSNEVIIKNDQANSFSRLDLVWEDAFDLMNRLVNELPNKAVEFKEKRRKLLIDEREEHLQEIILIDQKLKEL